MSELDNNPYLTLSCSFYGLDLNYNLQFIIIHDFSVYYEMVYKIKHGKTTV